MKSASKNLLFYVGVVAFALGLGVGVKSSIESKKSQRLWVREKIKSEAQIWVDQFFSLIETAKMTRDPAGLEFVTHRGVVRLNDQGAPLAFEGFESFRLAEPVEDRVLAALKTKLSLNDLRSRGLSVGTYENKGLASKEGVFIATPVWTEGSKKSGAFNKIQLLMVDPVKAFSGFQKMSNQNSRAFLLSQSGKILAHTVSAYSGTDLNKTEGLKAPIEALFTGANPGLVADYSNLDGERMELAFVRTGIFPFAIGVEQVSPTFSFWRFLKDPVLIRLLGMSFLGLGFLFVLLTVANAFARAEAPSKSAPPERVKSAVGTQKVPHFTAEIFSEKQRQIATAKKENDETARKILFERDFVTELEHLIAGARTENEIERILTTLSVEMTHSPIVYLRLLPEKGDLAYSSSAGDLTMPEAGIQTVHVRGDIQEQVEKMAAEGRIASITNYAPIANWMRSTLDIGQFEAWSVVTDGDVSGGKPRMLGVLIITKTGFRSSHARPMMAKMLRLAANRIFALSKKLKPHATQNPNLSL